MDQCFPALSSFLNPFTFTLDSVLIQAVTRKLNVIDISNLNQTEERSKMYKFKADQTSCHRKLINISRYSATDRLHRWLRLLLLLSFIVLAGCKTVPLQDRNYTDSGDSGSKARLLKRAFIIRLMTRMMRLEYCIRLGAIRY